MTFCEDLDGVAHSDQCDAMFYDDDDDDRFYIIVIFSAFEQTDCTFVTYDCKRVTVIFLKCV